MPKVATIHILYILCEDKCSVVVEEVLSAKENAVITCSFSLLPNINFALNVEMQISFLFVVAITLTEQKSKT